jgi:hypothetical protein
MVTLFKISCILILVYYRYISPFFMDNAIEDEVFLDTCYMYSRLF